MSAPQLLTLTPQPIFVIEAITEALLVSAPDRTKALEYANMWSDNDPTDYIGAYQASPLTVPRPRPYVDREIRGLVDRVWFTMADLPWRLQPKAVVPTYEEWLERVKPHIGVVAHEPYLLEGVRPEWMMPHVNTDHPKYSPTWNVFPVYFISLRPYVWYVQAETKEAAHTAVREMFITKGIYALSKPLAWADLMLYYNKPAEFDAKFPQLIKRPWQALFEGGGIVPYNGELVAYPGSVQYLSNESHPFRAPRMNIDTSHLPFAQ